MNTNLNIEFTIDLVNEAKNQLEFLENIESLKSIFEGEIIEKAIYRYEKLWLPYAIENEELVKNELCPPVDVMWIWHCHMLAPIAYQNDLLPCFGKILDHSNLSSNEIVLRQSKSQTVWQSVFNTSFDFLETNSVHGIEFKHFKTQFSYNLIEASKRQLEFYYQVSLPHFREVDFLKMALDRYKKFFYLKLLYKNEFVVPCYAIDIIWHSHQLNPIAYSNDTKKIVSFYLLNYHSSLLLINYHFYYF
jgi:hypothetical protein